MKALLLQQSWGVYLAASPQPLKIPLRSLNRSSGRGAPAFCGDASGDSAGVAEATEAAGLVAGTEVSEAELPHKA